MVQVFHPDFSQLMLAKAKHCLQTDYTEIRIEDNIFALSLEQCYLKYGVSQILTKF